MSELALRLLSRAPGTSKTEQRHLPDDNGNILRTRVAGIMDVTVKYVMLSFPNIVTRLNLFVGTLSYTRTVDYI